jgi:hypothetical protein
MKTRLFAAIYSKSFCDRTHYSALRSNEFVSKHKFLITLTAIPERIFITTAFHYRHHGKSMIAGSSDLNGNCGSMF